MTKVVAAAKMSELEKVQALKKHFVKYPMQKGSAHWSAGNKFKPSAHDLKEYDVVIDGHCNYHLNDRQPYIIKAHTYMQNTGNFAVSMAGMAGMNSNIWQKSAFDDVKYPTMVSKHQFETMAFVFAFAHIHLGIPIAAIKTHEEYARMKGVYPLYPNGYFPERWDLMDHGALLRNKILWYAQRIKNLY